MGDPRTYDAASSINGSPSTIRKQSITGEHDIAVIGFAARLPQDADSTEGFWKMIYEGRNASTEVPADRVNMDAYYHPNGERPDTCNVRRANFLTGDVAAFDAPFFSIQPIEAESMDPQQRILLETSYQALENAGLPLEKVSGCDVSVHVAASNRDYEVMLYRDSEQTPKYMGTGIGSSLLSNRLSWFFNFQGPSVSLDTACSGSLTALHLGCQGLKSGESNLALVGGVSLVLVPDASMTQLSTLGFLSPDGISYSFDHRANGYAKGEGATVVVLKRLADAIRDNDTIRAVIRGTALNQDGRTPGITQPSKSAQTANILRAYSQAGLSLDETGYFEAHGTGTAMGDPIEAEAIFNAFKRTADDPLYIGSLKANIGHLEANAGLAALVKSILVLEKGTLPPNACYEKTNPNIPEDEWGVKFLRKPRKFPAAADGLRRISINNFGYGGSNAHAIVDDAFHFLRSRGIVGKHCTVENPVLEGVNGYSKVNGHQYSNGINGHVSSLGPKINGTNHSKTEPVQLPYVLLWSAADELGIERLIDEYAKHFTKLPKMDQRTATEYLRNLSYTLSSRRSNLSWKSYSVVQSIEDLSKDLSSGKAPKYRSSGSPSISFAFTGQGAQWFAMAQNLDQYSEFARSLEKSKRYLRELGCAWSLREELSRDEATSRVNEADLSQPLCTAIQVALVDLLETWNIRPVAVVGHSSGEIAAAYCAKAISHHSAIKAAYFRGLVVTSLQKHGQLSGGMISVGLGEDEAEAYIAEVCQRTGSKITVGCVNSPSNITVTGDIKGIEDLEVVMKNEEVFARKLQVNVAYHSHHMASVASNYLDALAEVSSLKTSTDSDVIPVMFSSVTGDAISPERLSSKYWVSNLTGQVKFTQATQQMTKFLLARRESGGGNSSGRDIICEIGPHSALQRPIKDSVKAIPGAKHVDHATTLSRNLDPLLSIANFAGTLRSRGIDIDLVATCSKSNAVTAPKALADLPMYSFNHARTYWTESRFSKNHRFREFGRHELLGAREQDWNPSMPRWRNFIRIQEEHPWIRDHKFGGATLYPAAGMLVMAIEGARQLVGKDMFIDGYHLEHVVFPNGFTVPDESSMEAQLHFHPQNDKFTNGLQQYDFEMFGLVHKEWKTCCRGKISTQSHPLGNEPRERVAQNIPKLELGELEHNKDNISWEHIGADQFYESISHMQYSLGPAFQSLSHIGYNEFGGAKARINLDNWVEKNQTLQIMPHVIHPVNLDAILQTSVVAESQGGLSEIPVLIPTSIESLWISNALLGRESGRNHLKVSTSRTFKGFRDSKFESSVVDETGNICALLRGFKQTALRGGTDYQKSLSSKRLNYSIKWRPDIDTLTEEQVRILCDQEIKSMIPSNLFVDKQEMVSLFFMKAVIEHIDDAVAEKMPTHLQKYVQWAHHHFDAKKLEALRRTLASSEGLFGNEAQREEFLDDFAKEGPEAKLVVETGRNLIPILKGELDVLGLLFSNSLVADYYTSPSVSQNAIRLRPYVNLLAHKNPSLNVLEIGGGTGSATRSVLHALSTYSEDLHPLEKDIPRYGSYDFTDISPAFFEEAKQNFNHYPNMEYNTLNIEKDPLSQGFTAKQYDLIVCGAVLHATSDIKVTLENVHKLLKPGGKLVLIEPTSLIAVRTSLVFGLLPGWWLSSEELRKWGPCLSDEQWHDHLLETGFNGVEVRMPDHPDQARQMYSVLISSPKEEIQTMPSLNTTPSILVMKDSAYQLEVANAIRGTLGQNNPLVIFEDMSLVDIEGFHFVSLVELESSFFHDIHQGAWQEFKKLTTKAASILWVNRGCGMKPSDPKIALTNGMTRNFPSENGNVVKFRQLTISSSLSLADMAQTIARMSRQITQSEDALEIEYIEHDSMIEVPRLLPMSRLNRKIHQTVSKCEPIEEEFRESTLPLDLTIASPGLLDTLQFQDDFMHYQPLKATEVEIEVMATGMNFKDIMLAMGQLIGNTLGFECAGIITRAGNESQYRPGDRVCGSTLTGAYKTYVRADSSAVIKLPNHMTWAEAAAFPMVFATAYYSLVSLANLQEGESVLIHSGAGGVGQAAIQIAQRLKARVYTTVGSEEKRILLKDLYGLTDGHIFNSRDVSFAQAIKRIEKSGVDVVLNSLSSDKQLASWECIAPLGRFVELGKADIESSQKGLSMRPFSRNVSFHSVSLDVVMERAPATMAQIMEELKKMLLDNSNPIKPPYPINKFSVGHLEEAFRFMQTGKHYGKIVVEMHKGDKVPILPSLKPTYNFDPNSTYVLSGGLGGLGRCIISWMVKRKARNFLVLSRSGAGNNPAAVKLIDQMHESGVRIEAPPCDITDENRVSSVFREYREILPPVKGCIQGSMVLKDGILDNMDSVAFHAAVRPKTAGTMNLAAHLPSDLDFFVLLSSIASVTGSRGQANYSAANAFQDAFARQRSSRGKHCISLNLGAILSVGFAAEHNLAPALRRDGFEGVSKAEFLALLDYACDPVCPDARDPERCQIVSGLAGAETLPHEHFRDVYWAQKPMFKPLLQLSGLGDQSQGGAKAEGAGSSPGVLLAQASDQIVAVDVVATALVQRFARLMDVPSTEIDTRKPIGKFGIDSLVSMELRNWILKELRADVSVLDIMGAAGLENLAATVVKRSEIRGNGPSETNSKGQKDVKQLGRGAQILQ